MNFALRRGLVSKWGGRVQSSDFEGQQTTPARHTTTTHCGFFFGDLYNYLNGYGCMEAVRLSTFVHVQTCFLFFFVFLFHSNELSGSQRYHPFYLFQGRKKVPLDLLPLYFYLFSPAKRWHAYEHTWTHGKYVHDHDSFLFSFQDIHTLFALRARRLGILSLVLLIHPAGYYSVCIIISASVGIRLATQIR